jgi:hypothetical protein
MVLVRVLLYKDLNILPVCCLERDNLDKQYLMLSVGKVAAAGLKQFRLQLRR